MISRKVKYLIFVFFLLTYNLIFCQSIGIKAGGGVFIAENKELYSGIEADFYPEIGVAFEFPSIEAGIDFGFIWRKTELYTYSSWYGSSYDKSVTTFIPVLAYLKFSPLELIDKNFLFSPYIKGGAGAFIGAGDGISKDTYFAFHAAAGIDLNIVSQLSCYCEAKYIISEGKYEQLEYNQWQGRYNIVSKKDNLGGIFVTVGAVFKMNLTRDK